MERLGQTFGGEDMLILSITVTAPWVYTYAKTYHAVQPARVQFTLCQLHLSDLGVRFPEHPC